MRALQMILLLLAVLVLLVSAFFMGTETGLNLWYAGIAILMIDVVVCLIWPSTFRS